MPAQPTWFSRLDSILAALREIESPWLDRRAIEELFAVKPRRAQQLMAGLASVELVGRNAVVNKSELIGNLEALARGAEVAVFRENRRRAADEIAHAQAEAAAREVRVPVAPRRFKRRLENLPETLRLRPGRLEVEFQDINDLWRQLGELAGAAVNDREAFLETATPHPARPADD